MAIKITRTLEDGSTVVKDDSDGAEFALKAGQYARVAVLPEDQQRARIEQFVLENRASGDPRTEQEQEQVQANEQGQGERAQEQERD